MQYTILTQNRKYNRIKLMLLLLISITATKGQISDFVPFVDNNYVYTKNYLNIQEQQIIEFNEEFEFVDGLGRICQRVGYKGSPLQKDIVQPIEYDIKGREIKKYLPYAASNATGDLRVNWKTEQSDFYTTTLGFITDGPKAYSEVLFEVSPLDRVLKEGAPGDLWKIDNTTTARQSSEHILSYQYSTNISNEVYYWTISGTYPNITFTRQVYPAGSLYKTISFDENNKPSIVFKDIDGKIVLKCDAKNGKTYYIYDDIGLLRCVLSPEGYNTVSSAPFTINSSTFKDLCYYYEYDSRRRLIRKHIPGNTADYTMVYDSLDRLIETIDPRGITNYTDFDVYSRPIKTGIYENGLRNWKTITYYDRYNHDGVNYSSSSNFPYQNIYGYDIDTLVKDKVTVGILKIINPASGMISQLRTINYYDKYGRLVQSQNENHIGGRDIISYNYKYDNKDLIAKKKLQHWKSSYVGNPNITIEEVFNYDHTGRLLTSDYNLNGSVTRISTMSYYENSLLRSNIIENSLQTNTYKYNIRGWLTEINDINSTSSLNKLNMKLYYSSPYYNGNIRMIDTRNDWAKFRYTYTYDELNRLTNADYIEFFPGGGTDPSTNGKYSEYVSYDANGNFTSLTRMGYVYDGAYYIMPVDQLNYSYLNNRKSNRLFAVGDYMPDSYGRGDFNESASDGYGVQEFFYDNNGNVIQDKNRNIMIKYNFLNLPDTIKDVNGHSVLSHIYSANGSKLRQVSSLNTAFTNDYIGPIVYKNGILDHIVMSEGRALFTNGSFSYYEFFCKDHLGNIRAVVKRNITAPIAIQVNNYYPFGSLIGNSSGTSSNKYRYNGKELESGYNSGYKVDISWYDYGARFYDSQLGRWHSIDNLSEKYNSWSPYNYVGDNPVKRIDSDGNEWVDKNGQLIYDPKANQGKGAYTQYAGRNEIRLGNSLQRTETGKGQFNKLVNSEAKISTRVNLSPEIVYTDKSTGRVSAGSTDKVVSTEIGQGKTVSKVESAVITINVATMDALIKDDGTFSGEAVGDLSFDEFLGAVFGHEIEHTTDENTNTEKTGGDPEEKPHEISKKIIIETKQNKKDDENK